jgi:hypothetical protein
MIVSCEKNSQKLQRKTLERKSPASVRRTARNRNANCNAKLQRNANCNKLQRKLDAPRVEKAREIRKWKIMRMQAFLSKSVCIITLDVSYW